MTTEPLQNLTEQSAKIGAWLLVVAYAPQKTTYTWQSKGKSGTGQRLDWVLVSPDCSTYCGGTFKKKGSEPQATQKFNQAEAKFKKGTIWKVTNVTLAKQNPKYIGAPCKVLIDMDSSTFTPVLQSTVSMPTQAAPPEKLADLLQCPAGQLVDVTALVTGLSAPVSKPTENGPRDYVEVTTMDDSGEKGAARSTFPVWFKPGAAEHGSITYSTLQKALAEEKPVAFFNLVICTEDKQGREVLKTAKDHFSFHISDEGDKAQRLTTQASTIKTATEVAVITEMPIFTPNEGKDYLSAPATITSCRLLQYMMTAGGASEHTAVEEILQINHARVLEPNKNVQLHTKAGDRLFPQVRVVDVTGSVELRMRQKAVLALSAQADAGAFADLVSKGALNFPILCTMRIALRKRKDDEEELDVVIVEAAAQDVDEPKAMPNAAMDFLSQLMRGLPADANTMAAAPLSASRHGGHAGMIVDFDGNPTQATCVVSLVAHVGRSTVVDLPGGHKLVSAGCWNVPFEEAVDDKEAGAPEHANYKIKGELASYCTAHTVQDYTLTGRKPSDAVYAVIIVSGVHHADGRNTYMVDKVDTNIINKDNVPTLRSLLRKLCQVKFASTPTEKLNKTPDWLTHDSPLKAKKARTLGASPTDAGMD